MNIWAAAVESALESLRWSDNVRALSTHLTLYEKTSNVFFSPVKIRSLTKIAEPDRLILLIDDIYDMYVRLERCNPITGEPGFLSEDTTYPDYEGLFKKPLKRRPHGTDIAPPIELTQTETSGLRVELRAGMLRLLLMWRRNEMIVAENLAAQLNIPLFLIGVKHPLCVADELLNPLRSPVATYVSHPITTVRDKLARDGKWPDYTNSLNLIPERLADAGIVAIMPTAIDELRVGTLSAVEGERLWYQTTATPRWPLMPNKLINAPQGADAGLGLPATQDELNADQQWVSGILRSLSGLISTEVPFRDHFIVGNTSNFLVFRPREDGAAFSNGVIREIRHFQRKMQSSKSQKIADAPHLVIIHSPQDVKAIIQAMTAANVANSQPPSGLLGGLLGDNGASSLINDEQDLLTGKSISGLLQSPHPKASLVPLIRAVTIYRTVYLWLFHQLTEMTKIVPWVRVYIADNYVDQDFLAGIASLFHNSGEASDGESIVGLASIVTVSDLVDKFVSAKGWGAIDWGVALQEPNRNAFVGSLPLYMFD